MKTLDVDPGVRLETIRETLDRVRRQLFCSNGPVYKVWGAAWLLAFVLTYWVERGAPAPGLSGAVLAGVWIVITGIAGLYTLHYFRRQPVRSDVGARFGLIWPLAFTMMGLTVGSLHAAGLITHGIAFGVFAVLTLAIIFLVAGALLLDNLQLAIGCWFGVVNVIAMQFGFPAYALVAGLLGGGGLIAAGLISDRIDNRSRERR